jgi:hypothetical protein
MRYFAPVVAIVRKYFTSTLVDSRITLDLDLELKLVLGIIPGVSAVCLVAKNVCPKIVLLSF